MTNFKLSPTGRSTMRPGAQKTVTLQRAVQVPGALRGFTLVELMIVVAIIGVLAALAIYGVERYLANSKAAEAKQHVGAISRGATAAFERTYAASESVTEATLSSVEDHTLCDDAAAVPAGLPPAGKKYQPNTTAGMDFESTDAISGWQCLRFRITSPIYYQYHYVRNGPQVAVGSPTAAAANFEAAAAGDLNGDGTDFSYVSRTGRVNPLTGALKASSYLYVYDEAQ